MKTTDLTPGVLERLAAVRERCPEMRLGQILATIGLLAEDDTGCSLWEIEDTEFAAALERLAADLARRSDKTEPGAADVKMKVKAENRGENRGDKGN